MGTGISMSSVNKIKELAESGDYSLALDILDHQDLTKSLSPQFVRICGEVYYENKRYSEARAALVKAHSMAPVGNKIIFSLIQLYLSMGFYQLAEKYFEIYQFNQEARDAGTFRIEYLIARAKRKSIIELYSILLSANELETDEKWDYEMLLMHAAMNNMDKLAAEGEMFRATYKSSTRFGSIDALMNETVDVKALLYCFPEEEILDTDPEQQEIRDFEANVLQSDELRMHPKDPKIMIMVENNEPIPNSVKLKQMLARSKEKKEERREKKRDKSQGEDIEKTGLFGKNRISRKDEEAIEDVLAEQAEKDVNKEELLNEIISDSNDQTDIELETIDNPDMVELTDETTPEDKAVYNNDEDSTADYAFDESVDDMNFPDDEEFETVVMVDVNNIEDRDLTTSTASEPEEVSEKEPEMDEPEEISEVELSHSDAEEGEDAEKAEAAEGLNEYKEAVLISEEITEDDSSFDEEFNNKDDFDIDFAIQSLDEYKMDFSDNEIVMVDEEPNTSDFEAEPEEAELVPEDEPEPEEAESISEEEPEWEEIELVPEETEPEQAESIPEDEPEPEQAESIPEEEPEWEEIELVPEETEPEEAESIPEDEPEWEEAESVPEETEPEEVESIPEDEPEWEEAESVPEETEPEEAESISEEESDWEEIESVPEEIEPEEAESISEEEFEWKEIESVPEETEPEEVESISEEEFEWEEDESIPEDEPVWIEIESTPEEESELEEIKPILEEPEIQEESSLQENSLIYDEVDEKIDIEEKKIVQESNDAQKNLDFPVFKTSLFPDYNRDEPPVIQPSSKPKVEIDEEKINEHLKKEEDLLNETDKLLARLGIELGTNYSTGAKTFHSDEDDDVISRRLKRNSGNNNDNGFSLKKN